MEKWELANAMLAERVNEINWKGQAHYTELDKYFKAAGTCLADATLEELYMAVYEWAQDFLSECL